MKLLRSGIAVIALLAFILTSFALGGVLKKKVKAPKKARLTVHTYTGEDYHQYLGPYYQLWSSGGYTFYAEVERCETDQDTGQETCQTLSDDEVGELAAEYYQNVSQNFYGFKSWLEEQGYKVGKWEFKSENTLQLAKDFFQDKKQAFLNELATAYAGVNFQLTDSSDWERTQWPGRSTGIYTIKQGSQVYEGSTQLENGITLVIEATMTYKSDAVVMRSPLVLDLDGNGKLDTYKGHYLPLKEEVNPKALKLVAFDIDGTNYDVLVEWIGPKDGFLVMPKNVKKTLETGIISGDEMFGTAGGYTDGFAKLSLLDRNHDGVLTGKELEGLYVFQDKNQNGRVERGELKSVRDLGITEISVRHNNYKSYFIMKGQKRTMWDFWPITIEGRKLMK